jgi:hypothetical protein
MGHQTEQDLEGRGRLERLDLENGQGQTEDVHGGSGIGETLDSLRPNQLDNQIKPRFRHAGEAYDAKPPYFQFAGDGWRRANDNSVVATLQQYLIVGKESGANDTVRQVIVPSDTAQREIRFPRSRRPGEKRCPPINGNAGCVQETSGAIQGRQPL